MGKHRFFGLFAPWILLATVVCVPIVFSYAGKSVKDHANRVEDWLPGRYIETQQLSWFRQQFVADQFVVVSWDGCRLGGDPGDPDAEPDDPRIEQFARLMVPSLASGEAAGSASEPAEKTAGESQGVAERPASQVPQSSDTSAPNPDERDYFKEVTTARQVISQLTAPPTSLSYQQAVDRLKGTLVGPDGRQTCVVLAISESGAAHLREAIGRGIQGRRLVKRAEGELFRRARTMGLMPETIRLGGPPVDNVAIDEEGERTLLRLSSFAGLLGLILCWWSLRSVRLTVIVFCCAVLSAAVGLAIVGLTGQSTDAVLMSMPSLVYVLSISGAVHLINHYREALTEFGPEGAVERAIGHGWKPALICSITTALGLISLCTSELTPIRKFGLYSALGVMGMLAVLFLVLPAGLEVWHKRRIVAQMRRAKKAPKAVAMSGGRRADASHGSTPAAVSSDVSRLSEVTSQFEVFWQWLGGGIIRHHALVFTLCMLFIAGMGWGVSRLKTSIDLLKLFDPHARILQDYAWLEENLGRLVPMELVLRFPNSTTITSEVQSEPGPDAASMAGRLSFLDRLEATTLVEQSIERTFGASGLDIVGQTMSAATFAPEDPGQQDGPMLLRFARRSAASQQLEESRPAFEDTGFLGVDPADHAELWRVSVRVAAFRNVDYGQFVRDLRDGVEPIMAAVDTRTEVLKELALRRENGSYVGATVWMLHPAEQANRQDTAAGKKEASLWTRATQWLSWFGLTVPGASNPGEQEPVAYADNVYATYRQAINHFLRRSHLKVRWVEVTDANREQVLQAAAKSADCIVWTAGKGRALAGQGAASGLAAVPGLLAVDGAADLADRMRPPEDLPTATGAEIGLDTRVLGSQDRPAAIYTGVVPIVYKAQRELLNSLIESTLWSFITITPLMMFVSRGIRAGAVVMVPNTLPILVVFGGMGWLGANVDIGSMMSASIALGVAVDDTIHFLTWYREELAKGTERRQALLETYRRCASPTLQAALISGLGLSIFALSTFTPTQRFGWLMLTILLAGVVAELIMLPAMLAGPLGGIFDAAIARGSQGSKGRLAGRVRNLMLRPWLRGASRPVVAPGALVDDNRG